MSSLAPPDVLLTHERNPYMPRVRDFAREQRARQLDQSDQGMVGVHDHEFEEQTRHTENTTELESFTTFSHIMGDLDTKLGSFSTEARQLGRSFGILIAARKLREQLARMEFVCHENAAHIFPQLEDPHQKGHVRGGFGKIVVFCTRRAASKGLSLDCVPDQMEAFASALGDFRARLDEFREYDDGSINMKASIKAFEADLKYWAACLQVYEPQCYTPPIQKFVFHITIEIGDRIAHITSDMSLFIEIGMPAIRYGQKRDAKGLMGMSTGATFFSAVTATMLQISYPLGHTPLITIVNTFWFCSLVLSIGAALNSLLAMVWKQTIHGSRGHKLPLWVTLWIHASPPAFLVISIVCFSAGLVLFGYASQSVFTSSFTLVTTIVTTLGLTVIALWMANEQLVALAHLPNRRMNNSDVWDDHTTLGRSQFHSLNSSASSSEKVLSFMHTSSDNLLAMRDDNASEDGDDDNDVKFVPAILARARTMLSFNDSREFAHDVGHDIESQQPPRENPRDRNAWRITMDKLLSKQRRDHHMTQPPPITYVTPPTPQQAEKRMQVPTAATFEVLSDRIDIGKYGALQHLKFSPNGKYLASTSCQRTGQSTTVIYEVAQGRFDHSRVYDHAGRKFSGQLAWSFDSTILLIRLQRSIDIWTLEQERPRTIKRDRSVQSIRWYMAERSFVCIEKNTVVKLGLCGKEEWTCSFPGLKLCDIAVISPSRLVLVTRVSTTQDGLRPSHSKFAERQIVVYDILAKTSLFCMPVLDDVRHVTPTQNGLGVMISYRSKTPPQFWALEESKESEGSNVQLQVKSAYTPKCPEDFGGPSYPGNADQLVMCAGKTGDVHIWHRESGLPFHHFRAHDVQAGHGSPCSTWCPVPGPHTTFATGNESELKLWVFNHPSPGPGDLEMSPTHAEAPNGLEPESIRENVPAIVHTEHEVME